MVIGYGIIQLRIPMSGSLKEKKSVLNKILKRAQNEFNISISQVGDLASHQFAEIGFAMTGNESRYVNGKIDHLLQFVGDLKFAEVVSSKTEMMVVSDFLQEDDWDIGKIRGFSEKPNEIYDTWYKNRDFYPNLDMSSHFNELFDWLQNGTDSNHKLIKIGILLYEFLDKAPFTVGNQITAILVAEILSKKYGYNPNNLVPYFKSIEYISEDILAAHKMTKAKILLVDDEPFNIDYLEQELVDADYETISALNGQEALDCVESDPPDLILLDIMMPGETGLELTKSLRGEKRNVPILMLSALADSDDRIAGLATGSDDYLAKPFEPRELLLRINNLLRRVSVAAPARTEVRFGVFQLNVPRGELRRNGDLVRLTSAEKNLLRMLSLKPGTPFSRLELSQPGLEESARSVDVQINRLRQKIESDPANPVYLQTVRGAGYALYVDEEAAG